MRFFTIFALSALLLSSVMAEDSPPADGPTDRVVLQNKDYKNTYKIYKESPGDECINVKKAFGQDGTMAYTLGRPVKLYALKDCEGSFVKTKRTEIALGKEQSVSGPVLSFKVKGTLKSE
ncbi:hypothetical protein GGI21_001713 [Coemansia aciculifera]|nr:hypothetical protein GGI21_001713 [Coemansia aciculifera]